MSLTQNKYFWLAVGLYVFYLLGGWKWLDPLINPYDSAKSYYEHEHQRKDMSKRFRALLESSTLSTSEKVFKRLKEPFWTDTELADEIAKLETLQGHF